MIQKSEEALQENPSSPEVELPTVDLSDEFLADSISFLDELNSYKKKVVHLVVAIPWNGEHYQAMRLKAFLQNVPDGQKRTAKIMGTEIQHEEAMNISDVENVLNSGVKWELMNT